MRRTALIGPALGRIVFCSLAVAAVSGCKNQLDPADLKKFVTEFANNVGDVKSVNCGKVEAKVGATTTCKVGFAEGPERTADVVITEVLKGEKKIRYEVKFNPDLLNLKKITDYYLDFFPKQGLAITSLTCPPNQLNQVGIKFECVGKLKDGGEVKFASEVSKTGEVQMNSSSKLLDFSKLAGVMTEWANSDVGRTDATVDCGKGFVLMPDHPVSCKATVDGKLFELQANKDNFQWVGTSPANSKAGAAPAQNDGK